ncbi:unnamed protein product, partial [Acidithrix sp. C25]
VLDTGSDPRPFSYPFKWETDTVLSDGGTVAIRPIKSGDAPRIEAMHSRLSPETIYFRFFTPLPRLSEAMLSRFVNVDYIDRMALVALLGDDIIAVARYDRLPGHSTAEVAFLVDDAHQGRGLATIMLEFLVEAAKEAGIHTFIADTLPENSRMLRVFRDAGFKDTRSFQDGVIRVRFEINPTLQSVKRMQAREQRAVARSIARILAPRSIAVVGASRDPYSVGNVIFRNILESSFAGPVYPVNTSTTYVSSVKAYSCISEIPDEIDLAIVVIPASEIRSFISEAADKQVGGLVIISSGFSDTDEEGALAEREIIRAARRNGMRVVGPASMGVANTDPAVSLNATVAPFGIEPGRAALISHSGALGLAIVEEARRRGIGLSSFVSSGNRADVSGNDLLHYWELDPNTDVILLYLETFGNPRTFARVARRVARNKPIIAVKARKYTAGKTPSARNLSEKTPSEGQALSPSGKIIKSISVDIAVDALMKYTGVIRVDSLEQLFELGHGMVAQPLPRGRRVAILSNRGGPAPLAQDACENGGLVMAKLTSTSKEALSALISNKRISNPIELGPEVDPSTYGKVLEVLLNDENVDSVLVLYVPTITGRMTGKSNLREASFFSNGRGTTELPAITAAKGVAAAISKAAQQENSSQPKPVLANFLALPGIEVELRRHPREIPSFDFPEMAATVLSRMADHSAWKSQDDGEVPEFNEVDADGAALIIRNSLDKSRVQMEDGQPGGPATAWIVGQEGLQLLEKYGITAKDHVEVIGYLSFEVATQFEVSIVHDRLFGPILSMGVAGELSEYLDSKAYATLPLYTSDIEPFIDSIPAIGLIKGSSKRMAHDLTSIYDLIARLGSLIDDHYAISNLEATLVSTPTGAYIKDVEILVNDWSPMASALTRSLN